MRARVFTRPKTKNPPGGPGGLMRDQARSPSAAPGGCAERYVSAAHAASAARCVSARTFAEGSRCNSRDIALPSARTAETAQQKTLAGGAYQGSDEHKRPRLSFNERRYASPQYDSYAFVFISPEITPAANNFKHRIAANLLTLSLQPRITGSRPSCWVAAEFAACAPTGYEIGTGDRLDTYA